MDKIVSGWRYLGWPVPVVTEETRPDYVVLTMPVGAPHKKTPQENSTRKTGKKNRQEKSEKRTDLGVLPGAKIRF